MHILIISGDGDTRGYIQDTGIGINFIRVGDIDIYTSQIVKDTIHESAIYASSVNKGLCFTSNRKEIIYQILEHFEDCDNKIEFIKVDKKYTSIINGATLYRLLEGGYDIV